MNELFNATLKEQIKFNHRILHYSRVFLKTIKPRKQSKEDFYVAAVLNSSVMLRYCCTMCSSTS